MDYNCRLDVAPLLIEKTSGFPHCMFVTMVLQGTLEVKYTNRVNTSHSQSMFHKHVIHQVLLAPAVLQTLPCVLRTAQDYVEKVNRITKG